MFLLHLPIDFLTGIVTEEGQGRDMDSWGKRLGGCSHLLICMVVQHTTVHIYDVGVYIRSETCKTNGYRCLFVQQYGFVVHSPDGRVDVEIRDVGNDT